MRASEGGSRLDVSHGVAGQALGDVRADRAGGDRCEKSGAKGELSFCTRRRARLTMIWLVSHLHF